MAFIWAWKGVLLNRPSKVITRSSLAKSVVTGFAGRIRPSEKTETMRPTPGYSPFRPAQISENSLVTNRFSSMSMRSSLRGA